MKNINSESYCPRCQSRDVIDYGDFIHCLNCELDFDKELIGKIDDDEILARQELGDFAKSFEDDFKTPKKHKKGHNTFELDDL
ncbi:MAG: hypothetical protein ACFFB0_08505 [Promethearchaeota archaeon]